MQVCHGKLAPLRRIAPSDWVVYYSPSDRMGEAPRRKAFTALGRVARGDPYQVDMGDGFCPYRRDVVWVPAEPVPITPLLDDLELTHGRRNWGYALRFGLVLIGPNDMHRIASAMGVAFASD